MRKLTCLVLLGLPLATGCSSGRKVAPRPQEHTLLRTPDAGISHNDTLDSDCDGLSDGEEFRGGTDPARWDTDDDGLSDGVERGTARPIEEGCPFVRVDSDRKASSDPTRKDTDGDGIPDGVEDRNRNGVQDAGETNPRSADSDDDGVRDAEEVRRGSDPLSPWSRPDIPEAMVFDLVRPLGARKGEFEVNALSLWSRRGGFSVAPEIEYAFLDNHAIEFELPMHGGRPEALKVAYQPTFGALLGNQGIHGLQFITEAGIHGGPAHGTALYLLGYRWSPAFSGLLMAGARGAFGDHSCRRGCALLNGSVFAEATRSVQLGLETTLQVSRGGSGWMLMPQVRWHSSQRINIQLGLGLSGETASRPALTGGLRFVVEL